MQWWKEQIQTLGSFAARDRGKRRQESSTT